MVQSKKGRQRRGVAFVSVALASVLVFAMLGGVELAQSAIGLVQYQYGKKVTICHKGHHTVRIAVRAWPAHKRHGDVVGTCAAAAKRFAHGHAAKPGASASGKPQSSHGTQGQGKPQSEGKPQAGSGTTAAAPGKSGSIHGNAGGNGNRNGNGNGKGHG
jgi:hypothetical protein